MQGIKRRIVYLTLYEALAILSSAAGLALVMDAGPAEAGVLSVVASIVAVVWNLVYNVGFEALEARFDVRGRRLGTRIVHAVGFELGLVVILVPLFARVLGVTLVEAFLLDIGMILYFLAYTFLFNLAFDRIFGLPASARVRTEACEAACSPMAPAG